MVQNQRLTVLKHQSIDVGALGRNVGEVIGVFADVVPVKDPKWLRGFVSSVKVKNLEVLEESLRTLKPPRWPDAVLGVPDKALVATGARLYDHLKCDSCHAKLERTDLRTPIKAHMVTIASQETQSPNASAPTRGWPATPISTNPMPACWQACRHPVSRAKSRSLSSPMTGLPTCWR